MDADERQGAKLLASLLDYWRCAFGVAANTLPQ